MGFSSNQWIHGGDTSEMRYIAANINDPLFQKHSKIKKKEYVSFIGPFLSKERADNCICTLCKALFQTSLPGRYGKIQIPIYTNTYELSQTAIGA